MIKQELEDLTRRNAGTGQTLLALAHKVLQEEGKELPKEAKPQKKAAAADDGGDDDSDDEAPRHDARGHRGPARGQG